MKIRVGIVGYGNLGKAVEEEILKNKNFKLIAIFSRRVVVSKFNSVIEPYDVCINYKDKIDIMIMCGGSANDVEIQLPEIAKFFNTINSFDIHSKLEELIGRIDKINKENKTVSLSACGWDPGLFSIIRGLMFAISGETPTTFWGKGISMGHSDAVRNVDGVIDGLQFTIPNKEAVSLAKKGKIIEGLALHNRRCYVACDKNKKKIIESQIKNIPNYFKGQPTFVEFVPSANISKLKCNMSHKGLIVAPFRLSVKNKAYMEFSAKMDSNPAFTAKIMVRFIFAVIKLKKEERFEAFLPMDIPLSSLLSKSEREFVIKNLC